ncbi:MAG: type II toxin-antitoxin system VapC family toxin [Patescibacteria group bacterium]
MINEEEFRKLITNRYVLFDTNVFIRAFQNFDSFEVLVSFLRGCEVDGVSFPLIKFEFLRTSFAPDNRKSREDFIDRIAPSSLSFRSQIIDDALDIARMYASKGVRGGESSKAISLVDCCIAAYLKQYATNLFLITLNHKDFPQLLFDRLFVFPIEAGDEVLPIAFYRFNVGKWNKCLEDFKKLGK